MATPIYEFAQLPQAASAPETPARSRRRERVPGTAPRVGVIFNPRSHRNRDADHAEDGQYDVRPHVHVAKPWNRSELPEALARFAERGIDLLVINGGDGTVRDVLTCGRGVFGDDWPTIAVLPSGKTNALTVDLGVPKDWSLQDAIDAFERGEQITRRPIEVSEIDEKVSAQQPDGDAESAKSRVLGFILGAGAFTHATSAGQSAHKLGAFNGAVVAITTFWGLAQMVLATRKNPWRRGARMAIRLGKQRSAMVHSGSGDPEFRQLLFATTLEQLPANLKPFGHLRTGLRIIALDQINRRTTSILGLVATGKLTKGLRKRGIHQLSVPEFTMTLDESMIVDGEAFPPGSYRIAQGPSLTFVAPALPAASE
ncbi:MAG: diacylglycerol kinase family protein [Pseudomonadota bacterium]